MCWLCRLGADSDVLVTIWQHLPLRSKLCHLIRLSRCAHLRRSLLLPAVYVHDEVHVVSSTRGADSIAESVAAVCLPSHLAHIRHLSVVFTSSPQHELASFPHLSRLNTIDQWLLSAPSAQPTADQSDQREGARSIKRRRLDSVGLAWLTHLQTLILSQLHCSTCGSQRSDGKGVWKPLSTASLPYLPQLRTLVMKGELGSHCLPLLLSIPTQCPQLTGVDIEGLCVQSVPTAEEDGSDADEDEKVHDDSLEAAVLPFVQWSAGINHALHCHGALGQCETEKEPQADSTTVLDEHTEYAQIRSAFRASVGLLSVVVRSSFHS